MSQIQQVKEATDIVALINERVPLQRSGANYRANCPFHGEKTPSFFVNEVIQRYKCFGCGESGDVFTFLEKYESMTFAEALEYLADQAGIELEKHQRTPEDDKRDQIMAALNLAKEYYHYLLTKHPAGEQGREYLKQRGVTQESVRLFQLGYALPEWEGLLTYLNKKKKISVAILDAAGLVVKGKQGRFYDRFRERVVFPLTNHRGQVVGFSGRTLNPEEKTAKYINSPETEVYHKSELLFGYHELRQFIRTEQTAIVTEGELDVISSAQAHVNNVVGLKGSALTEKQAQLLERVANKVILALDADSAGVEATKRAIQVSAKRRYELRVVVLPEGKDPDQLAQTKPALWRETVKQSVSVPDFFLTVLQKQFDVNMPEGKRDIMVGMTPVLLAIDHAVERDFYIKKVAKVLAVSESVVKEDLRKGARQEKLPKVAAPKIEAAPAEVVSVLSQLEQRFLFLLFADERQTETRLKDVARLDFPGVLRSIMDLARQFPTGQFSFKKLIHQAAADQQQLLMDIVSNPQWGEASTDQADKEWKQITEKLDEQITQEQRAKLIAELNSLDEIEQLTPEQEARQQQLLIQVAQLNS